MKKRNPIYLVLDDIRSLGNVGAIFRTSEGVLVKKLYLCGITGRPPRQEIEKTALKTTKLVPWEYQSNALKVVRELKKEGVFIISLELTPQSVDYTKAQYQFPLCLVVGNEIGGIKKEILDESDLIVKIPILGQIKSLNVATAYGLAVYEILKQLNYKK
ncbi:MAG: TrmH family RNA methyltransferase [Candidatus Aenigmarchaeota archaeon]|nr:TrmH family RNA methyltransferase [Candidatus Aenigmarchaeota archaeon]